MERLNFQHLLYFSVVAREGGLAAAGRALHLSHPTLSAQIHALEDQLGEKLFERSGRRLVLTEMGRVVLRYAEEIFSLGHELVDAIKGRASGHTIRLEVGISDVVPKIVVRRLLQPALALETPVHLVCREDRFDRLLAELSLHTLDLVIADAPIPPGSGVRAYNHLLGETGVTFFAQRTLARKLRKDFPLSLGHAPLLLPAEGSVLRRALNAYFDRHRIHVHIVAEFEDSALLKVFGGDGLGIFPAPTIVEEEIQRQYRVEIVGRVPDVQERFYAISAERRLKNPASVAISNSARSHFGST